MFYVHRSNRAEKLVEMLGDFVGADPPGPFDSEPIIVQGRGMERWLSMELARRFGVWANPRFPFPRVFLLDLFAANLDADPGTLARFEPEALTWAIAARLPELVRRPELRVLERYLEQAVEGDDTARLLSLAAQIARTFDDYVVYRSDLIAGWERVCDGSWESILWRRLVADLGSNHVAARARQLLDSFEGGAELDLPRRVSIFGISTLAPLYLQIFAELAAHCDVHLFVLSPSAQYWADVRGRREVVAELLRRDAVEEDELDETLEREVGNRLLASLGRIGREFQAVLEGTADYEGEEKYEDAVVAGGGSALAQLQSDMLDLVYRSAGGMAEPVALLARDRSLLVQSCHGPMREVQVLHDQLRAMFDADATLRPRDIIVMTPDVDAYAPFIDAVFDGGDAGQGIPFRIADRGPQASSEVFEAFSELLRVLPGRMTSAEVVDLLRLSVIRRRFGFDEADIEVVREWIDRSEVRWGIDAAHRAMHGHPPVEQNTWEFGLRRLFLGYAVGDDDTGSRPYAPYDDLEGSDAAILGRLAELCEHLFGAAQRYRAPLAIADWPAAVSQLIDGTFAQDGAAAFQSQALRAAIEAIAMRAAGAGYDGSVDVAMMTSLIEDELRLKTLAHGFLTGDVTFCELVPMRTIPFRVVCLIGMNDGNFPRAGRRPDFDRIGQRRRWGDRSLRDDDRYMFLEALLSAREKLYVSYVGQDAQTNSQLPPSVVVQELLDTLTDSFAGLDGDSLVVGHPMQAFSPRYFDRLDPEGLRPELVSYSKAAYEGARALVGERSEIAPFISGPVAWSPAEVISLYDFVRFFENPTRAFLQKQLKIYLGRDLDTLDTREPLDLDNLERWALGDEMLARTLAGKPCDFETLARSGSLPLGAIGQTVHEEILAAVGRIAAGATAGPGEPVEIDVELGDLRIAGTIEISSSGEQTVCQYSKIGGRQELSLWVRHLFLCLSCADRPVESRLFGRSSKGAAAVSFAAATDPRRNLLDLAGWYAEGMRVPLPLFESASRAYAKTLLAGKTEAVARRSAERAFTEKYSDAQNEYVAQIYGDSSPFSCGGEIAERAAGLAVAVYRDFLAARDEVEL